MKTVVLGAGVIGVTTAYELARRGHDVTVIEREASPGLSTSFANGGQLSPSEAVPWASPSALRLALGWLTKRNAPFRLKLEMDPHQWGWLIRFALNCSRRRWARHAPDMIRLAAFSRERLAEIRTAESIDYDCRRQGILRVFDSAAAAAEEAAQIVPVMRDHGIELRPLDADECVAVEPALADAVEAGRVQGGIHAPDDESGDAYLFTCELAERATAFGVRFLFRHTVQRLEGHGDRVQAVLTDCERVPADIVVCCLGLESLSLLRRLGLEAPIYPVTGYSATIPVDGSNKAPTVSVTDQANRFVVSRLGERLRVAGKADIVGYGPAFDEQRADDVLDDLFRLFPEAGDRHQASRWVGRRPMTPDGVPLVGTTDVGGLYLNAGHGSLGWTMACGSAAIMADIIDRVPPAIDIAPYAPRHRM